MPRNGGNGTKKQDLAEEVARAVGAARPVAVETVDFGDPARPKTCLEVDFPIVPVNHVAIIEGNAGKPIYQMSKWWARRRSSVFRATLLAASMKAPADPAQAAKSVWSVYYANHQKKGALRHLKVADIFMGGGTTLVEGARLGMQMWGTDLNPVAWFIVKNELAKVSADEVKALLDDVEAEVKPQIMPFYACDCPRGHRGTWRHLPTGRVMSAEFDPLTVSVEERTQYRYEGPEIIYIFWAKHGPCQVLGCGHRTPVMSSPVMAVKAISVRAWENHRCRVCHKQFDIEHGDARMAPGVPLVVAETERPFSVLDEKRGVACPHCGDRTPARLDEQRVLTLDGSRGMTKLGKGKNKKIELSLLVHPQWLSGTPKLGDDGTEYGGSVTDAPEATAAWNRERTRRLRLVEVRGALPPDVTCPATKVTFSTEKGTVPKKSNYACGACGTVQDVLETVKRSGKTGPVAAYAIQGYCTTCDREGKPYGGRFFMAVTNSAPFDAAVREWDARNEGDLKGYWPRSELPYGFMTHLLNGGIPNHGFTHWWKMFNARQLLGHAQLLRAIIATGTHRWDVREYVLGAFQQYLRNQNMFCFWDISRDGMAPALSNANFHPKSTVIEGSVFADLGRGNWISCSEALRDARTWAESPWELVSTEWLASEAPVAAEGIVTKSGKVECGDPVLDGAEVASVSATDLSALKDTSFDLVITDPPFGGLLHYSELSDFFYVWLRLVLKDRYPDYFGPEYAPKALEVVSNRARQPEDADGFYKRLLTQCWREAQRILKPGGLLAFTFHHSEDAPWVAVLESLFEAGFYLEATYPIRSDETKGEGEFGARKQEYDIIHVCRKRMEEPKPVSWGRMRREVLGDIRGLRSLLEHHAKAGLPAADIKLIKYGKALEYYSRHYGKVYVDETRMLEAKDAVAGIVQLVEEEGTRTEPPPINAEPLTRQILRIFDGQATQPRDQVQKSLRGTGVPPEEFEVRGWCREEKKVFHLVSPLDIARAWQGRHRRNMVSDYDQAMFLIGACFDGSGINASDTLNNANFKPHPALGALLEWHARRGAGQAVRNAAARALAIFQGWERAHPEEVKQLSLVYGG
jgi:putative DNA methylase